MIAIPFRDDTPLRREPVTTWGLIGLCAAVFLWQAGLSPRDGELVAHLYGMVPGRLFGTAHLPARLHPIDPGWTLVTSMFLHGGWLHLIGNMLYLWLFGRGVESALGPVRFLALYLASGVAAALAQAMTDPASLVPMVGASGAIAGVLGAYLLLYPRATVDVFLWIIIFVRVIRMPAPIMLGLWFLLQLVSGLAAHDEPGVAFWAHVGGFLAGMALVTMLRPAGAQLFQTRRASPFGIRRMAPHRGASVPRSGPWRRGPWG